MKQYLSATAFARLIEKDPKTVITWIRKGLIPQAKRMGHTYRIPHEEVERAKTNSHYPPRKPPINQTMRSHQ
ncbi:MAG: helix-turn-helix domain-containing protein [Ardenticatenales bacterium]|nr:helix-turn-helix domain-containing protein [Ardenticatenales bacterium]